MWTYDSPFGDNVTAGIECIDGSAMYLKSTGISLQKEGNVYSKPFHFFHE